MEAQNNSFTEEVLSQARIAKLCVTFSKRGLWVFILSSCKNLPLEVTLAFKLEKLVKKKLFISLSLSLCACIHASVYLFT